MLKYLLIAVVVIWLLYSPILRRARQLKRDRRTAAPTAAPGPAKAPQVEDMVACAHCGVHLPASEAFRDAARLIWKLGGTQETVYGLAGLGDTFASAFSPLGRNRQFGELLGQGNTIAKAQSVVKDTVEGITAVDCLHKLALREKLRLPVLQAAYDVVVGKEKSGKVFEELLKNL